MADCQGHASLEVIDYNQALLATRNAETDGGNSDGLDYGGPVTSTWADGTTNLTSMTYTEGRLVQPE